MTREEYFCSEYLKSIYYFCLKKTNSETEAEDLAGEISLEILVALNKGILIDHFEGFVWKIARNRYAHWAERKHKKSENELYLQEDEKEEIAEKDNIEDDIIRKEILNKLRRELTLIEKEYREILVGVAEEIYNRELLPLWNNMMGLAEEVPCYRFLIARK